MKRIFLIFFIIAILIEEACARDIYVRLASGGTCHVASDHSMTLTDGAGKSYSLGKSASLVLKGGKVTVGKHAFTLPARVSSSGLLRFNKKSYRGAFMLTQKGGLLNVLDIELYLRGVLPAEVGSDWPGEALRAQAIISRTYALRQSLGRAERGYDVVDTVSDQVYRGAGVETAKTNQAVASTAHKVLAYGKELAFTPFHSDSGGYTASNLHVWGTDVPYLTGVAEPIAYSSPVSSWTARISAAKITQAVAKLTGANIAPITGIRVSDTDKGGRAINLTFVGAKGSRTVNASKFRLAIGSNVLKSTMLKPSAADTKSYTPLTKSTLSSQPVLNRPSAAAVSSSKSSQTIQELYDIVFNNGGKAPARKPNNSKPSEMKKISIPRMPQSPSPSPSPVPNGVFSIAKSGNDFIFYGRGWGHGVGLSQWGAQALAKKGWTAEKILTHYYPGTAVKSYQ